MLEFIRPSIEKRIELITQENDEKLHHQYSEFEEILSSIKPHLPEHLKDAANKLEAMYIQRVDEIAPVYRTGFDDAINLFHFFQNISGDEYKLNKT